MIATDKLGEYSKGSKFHPGTKINYLCNDNQSLEDRPGIVSGTMKQYVILDLLSRNSKKQMSLMKLGFHYTEFCCSLL